MPFLPSFFSGSAATFLPFWVRVASAGVVELEDELVGVVELEDVAGVVEFEEEEVSAGVVEFEEDEVSAGASFSAILVLLSG